MENTKANTRKSSTMGYNTRPTHNYMENTKGHTRDNILNDIHIHMRIRDNQIRY